MSNETETTQPAAATDAAATAPNVATNAAQESAPAPATATTAEQKGEIPASTTTASDTKTDGKQEEPVAQQKAPEKYEFKAPEGTVLDETVKTSFEQVARDLNLSQESAQTVLDKMLPVIAKHQAEQINTVVAKWEADARADKEFGGDKFDENLAIAKAALKQFGNEPLMAMLNESKLGNHPEVIRMLVKVGSLLKEDSVVNAGKGQATSTASLAQQMYPHII